MARPRKPDTERMEDWFYDLDYEEQKSVLNSLTLLHRMKGRHLEKSAREPLERAIAATRAMDEPAKESDGVAK